MSNSKMVCGWVWTLRTDMKMTCLKRDRTTCTKFVNYSRLNSQHSWGTYLFNSVERGIFTLILKKIFTRALKMTTQMAPESIWIG